MSDHNHRWESRLVPYGPTSVMIWIEMCRLCGRSNWNWA
jgi:hypothetical protein